MFRVMSRTTVLTFSLLVSASAVFAQNTTPNGAIHLTPGQISHQSSVDGVNTARWFVFFVVGGRSYCVDVVVGATHEVFTGSNDPALTVYAENQSTVVTGNDDILDAEPGGIYNSRACWIASTDSFNFLKVVAHQSGQSATYSIRLAESTLFSNWFFLGGDYSSFTLLRNTTNKSVLYKINWRNAAGAVVASQSGVLSPNGSTYVDARSKAAALSAVSGTVEIAHAGSFDAIMATTTVLSATTGLSFDTMFAKRTVW